MYIIFIVFSLILFAQNDPPLSLFKWNKRIILLAGDDSLIKEQINIYKKVEDGISDRDIIIIYQNELKFNFFPESDKKPLKWEDLKNYYNLEDKKFTSILIGKDGGVKQKDHQILPSNIYFRLIDAMPMRMQEMRKKN